MNPAIFGQKNIKTRLFWLNKQTSPTSVCLVGAQDIRYNFGNMIYRYEID